MDCESHQHALVGFASNCEEPVLIKPTITSSLVPMLQVASVHDARYVAPSHCEHFSLVSKYIASSENDYAKNCKSNVSHSNTCHHSLGHIILRSITILSSSPIRSFTLQCPALAEHRTRSRRQVHRLCRKCFSAV